MENQKKIELLREEILKKFDNNIIYEVYSIKPFYVTFFDFLEEHTRLNRYILYLLVSLIPYLVFIPFSSLLGNDSFDFTKVWLKLNFSGWAFGCFLFMNYIYHKSVEIYPLLHYLANTAYNKHHIEKLYDFLFISKYQIITCIATGILTTATGTYLDFHLTTISKYYIIFNSFIIGFIIGTGLWYSIGLANLIRTIGRMKNVKINYINPTYSIGVFEIPKLASVWSLCFFSEVIIVYLGLILPDWNQNYAVIQNMQVFWLIIFISISIYNFVHPISAISKLTNDAKTKIKILIMDNLYSKLSEAENNIDKFHNNYAEIKVIEELYEKIAFAKTYIFDWSVFFRFLATTIPSIVILILKHYSDIMDFLMN